MCIQPAGLNNGKPDTENARRWLRRQYVMRRTGDNDSATEKSKRVKKSWKKEENSKFPMLRRAP